MNITHKIHTSSSNRLFLVGHHPKGVPYLLRPVTVCPAATHTSSSDGSGRNPSGGDAVLPVGRDPVWHLYPPIEKELQEVDPEELEKRKERRRLQQQQHQQHHQQQGGFAEHHIDPNDWLLLPEIYPPEDEGNSVTGLVY